MAHVMVVDDDAACAALLGMALRGRGHSVATAYDGQEALLRCAAEVPDLLVTDLAMPLLDGAGLVRALRARWPALPVIVLTGSAAGEPLAPGVAVLAKPARLRHLLGHVEAALAA